MMRLRIMSKRTSSGQSLAEFAIVLPMLMVIVLGTIDLGRVFFAYISVTNAARNGAQYAATSVEHIEDMPGIQEAALADTDQLGTGTSSVDVSVDSGSDSQGFPYAEVTVTYNFETLFPWPGLPASMVVRRTVRTMVAQ